MVFSLGLTKYEWLLYLYSENANTPPLPRERDFNHFVKFLQLKMHSNAKIYVKFNSWKEFIIKMLAKRLRYETMSHIIVCLFHYISFTVFMFRNSL